MIIGFPKGSRAVVLLSSGLDSTVNLHWAREIGEVTLAVTFDYGQRAQEKEILQAKKICEMLKVPHKLIRVPFFSDFGASVGASFQASALMNSNRSLPLGANVQIDDHQVSLATAKSVWVPNRNGIFLNIAAGFAEALQAEFVIPGFNREEASTFPDNSEDFLLALERGLSYSTANQVKCYSFTTKMDKTEIVKKGLELNVDWKLLWPCYQALGKWCGECESCLRAKRAFSANQLNLSELFLK